MQFEIPILSERPGLVAVLFVILIMLPFFIPDYYLYLLLRIIPLIPVILGLNLLLGYMGYLSFGQGLFYALGIYIPALTLGYVGSLGISLIAAVLISGVVGAGVGYICLRRREIFFAMLTLSFSMIFYFFLVRFSSITGGTDGLSVPRPNLLGFSFSKLGLFEFFSYYYYYVLVIVIIATLIMYKTTNSHFGLSLKTIKENPTKAKSLGIDIDKYKLYAFTIAAVYAAIGGVLISPVLGHADPGATYWTKSGDFVFMTLLGGIQSYWGPLLGIIFFKVLKAVTLTYTPYWRLIIGLILLIVVILIPGGLIGIYEKISSVIREKLPK